MDKIFNLLIFLLNPPMVLTEKEINNTLCKFQMKNYKKKKTSVYLIKYKILGGQQIFILRFSHIRDYQNCKNTQNATGQRRFLGNSKNCHIEL